MANSRWNAGGRGSSAQQYARALAREKLKHLFVGPREIAKIQSFLARRSAISKNTVAFCSLPRKDFFNACQHLNEKGCRVIYRIVDSWQHFACECLALYSGLISRRI